MGARPDPGARAGAIGRIGEEREKAAVRPLPPEAHREYHSSARWELPIIAASCRRSSSHQNHGAQLDPRINFCSFRFDPRCPSRLSRESRTWGTRFSPEVAPVASGLFRSTHPITKHKKAALDARCAVRGKCLASFHTLASSAAYEKPYSTLPWSFVAVRHNRRAMSRSNKKPLHDSHIGCRGMNNGLRRGSSRLSDVRILHLNTSGN
jgi:uncharacterized CHY-type Zn-finger protein